MPSTLQTPGVYIEEISSFPPSVAQVATAIPAFIGHTEKAEKIAVDDLRLQPVRVSSLLEYNTYFGGAPDTKIKEVLINNNNSFNSATLDSKYYLYESLRLFFANGGGACYIISVGGYQSPVDYGDDSNGMLGGLKMAEKEDEPTILVFPDAVLLEDKLYKLQKEALMQCNNLGDRVCIFDLTEKIDLTEKNGWDKGVQKFRNNIGINSLKYGAAYTPWLITNFPKNVRYRNFKDVLFRAGSTTTTPVKALTTDADITSIIDKLNNIVSDVNHVHEDLDKAVLKESDSKTLEARYLRLRDDINGESDETKKITNLVALFNFLYSIPQSINDAATDPKSPIKGNDVKNILNVFIKDRFFPLYEKIVAYDKAADKTIKKGSFNKYTAFSVITEDLKGTPADTEIFSIASVRSVQEKINQAIPFFNAVFNEINAAFSDLKSASFKQEELTEKQLSDKFPYFSNLVANINKSISTVPPSGAIAGIYALTDQARGVWKAPANVSLNGVVGLTQNINNQMQDTLNIDAEAGKSINALRAFTGRGIIVWGARTLAGNDNEWRFVPVRRLFNMVEESVKKSTAWAVFEPNDANTWIRVKAMIENFLTVLWREGALAGAKPDEAFFVKIGLGVTMTAQDILNGIMNIEIGMAAVRPAEFIVLKFSHKLQQS